MQERHSLQRHLRTRTAALSRPSSLVNLRHKSLVLDCLARFTRCQHWTQTLAWTLRSRSCRARVFAWFARRLPRTPLQILWIDVDAFGATLSHLLSRCLFRLFRAIRQRKAHWRRSAFNSFLFLSLFSFRKVARALPPLYWAPSKTATFLLHCASRALLNVSRSRPVRTRACIAVADTSRLRKRLIALLSSSLDRHQKPRKDSLCLNDEYSNLSWRPFRPASDTLVCLTDRVSSVMVPSCNLSPSLIQDKAVSVILEHFTKRSAFRPGSKVPSVSCKMAPSVIAEQLVRSTL